jgi:ATP-dependent RNA helicase DHX29
MRLADMVDQRGVATTSVASKKQVEEAKAAKEAEASALKEAEAAAAAETLSGVEGGVALKKDDANDLNAGQDWEDDDYVEQQSLQSLVDRLHDKGEKEVTRVVKVSYDLCVMLMN